MSLERTTPCDMILSSSTRTTSNQASRNFVSRSYTGTSSNASSNASSASASIWMANSCKTLSSSFSYVIESSPDVTEPSSDLLKVKSGSNFLGEGTSSLDESDELNESTFKRLVLDSGGTRHCTYFLGCRQGWYIILARVPGWTTTRDIGGVVDASSAAGTGCLF